MINHEATNFNYLNGKDMFKVNNNLQRTVLTLSIDLE